MQALNEGINFFTTEINHLLGLKEYYFEESPYQHTGNCAWIAAKMVAKSVLVCLGLMQDLPPEQGIKLGMKEYKKWFYFDRRRSFIDIKNSKINPEFSSIFNIDEIFAHLIERHLFDEKIDFLDFIFKEKPELLFFKQKVDGCTWLHKAIEKKQVRVMEYLLKRGLDPNAFNNRYESCLLYAIKKSFTDQSVTFEEIYNLLKRYRVNEKQEGDVKLTEYVSPPKKRKSEKVY